MFNIYTHTKYACTKGDAMHTYEVSYIHTNICTSKTLFCVRIYGRHFLFYFVTFSMFTCGRINEFIYAFMYQIVVNLERQRNCTHLCIFTQYKIGNDMCLEISNVAQTHTHTHAFNFQCVYAMYVCMYIHANVHIML